MKRTLALVAGLFAFGQSGAAHAVPADDEPSAPSSWGASRSLQVHFGIEAARRLVHGEDPGGTTSEDTLRGIDRAVALGSQEGVLLLVQLLSDAHGLARSDSQVLLSATRALAPFAAQPAVARVLAETVMNTSAAHPPPRPGQGEPLRSRHADADRHARIELARESAALALARARDPHATDLLVLAARGGGPGQSSARRALAAFPPVVVPPPIVVTPSAVTLWAALGDLRTGESILESTAAPEAAMRVAALRGCGALGDTRCIAMAESSSHDADPGVRVAATAALIDLGSTDSVAAVRRLIEDDATAMRATELAGRVQGDEIVGALAARVRASSDLTLRTAAIAALGLQKGKDVTTALRELMADPVLVGAAAEALARSSDPGVWDVIALTLQKPAAASGRRMAARMAALRGRVEGSVPDVVMRGLRDSSREADGADRAAGVAALVLLGDMGPESALADSDARVRRAAAMACEPTDGAGASALAERLAHETDPSTRLVLARGLASAMPGVTTTFLQERVREGGSDAPLAALALARWGEDAERDAILKVLASADPVLRAHTARGLGMSLQPWATGQLADAYEVEVDTGVRAAIVAALAARRHDAEVPARARALDRAERLDPDPTIRTIAGRALRGLPAPRLEAAPDAAWLRVMDEGGRPPKPVVDGTLLRADGLAVPVTFDDDGYALTTAPRGPARLLLAPRLRAYEPVPHGD